MTYIKLEDVQKILESIAKESKKEFDLDVYPWWISKAKKRIKILPSINPEEMIEEVMNSFENEDIDIKVFACAWLQILLQKFKS